MNKKKYFSVGTFAFVIALGVGIAYYFDATAINNILGIGSMQIDSVSDADILTADTGSSSLPASDSENDVARVSSSALQAKQTVHKAGNAGGSGVVAVQTTGVQAQPVATGTDINNNDTVSSSVAAQSPISSCSFPTNGSSTTRRVILNEIAWMGSASSSDAEWIEIKNNFTDTIDLSGWELSDASGKIKIFFAEGDVITPGGLLLLMRGSASGGNDQNNITAEKIYSGDLTNAGDVIALMDPQCDTSDYLDASNGWPGGNNTTKATLERDADGIGWHTSALPGGTPGAENSAGPLPAQYTLSIAFQGDSLGATLASDPAGLVCATTCTGSFASGTKITLTPTAGINTAFKEWSGSCSGETICSFVIATTTSLVAEFQSTPVATPSTSVAVAPPSSPSSSDGGGGDVSPPAEAVLASHVLIAAVQIAAASSSNDFVRLYNPASATVDMSGWKLHKRSNTGADYSLKEFPAGSMIGPGQSFVWANSAGGFSGAVGADVSSTETLAADNSVALMDGAGNVVDAVAWGTGSGQYGEGPPYPTDPGPNQVLARTSSGGVMVDTDNNANDFALQ